MKDVISALILRKGEYEGQGINHEGQPFIGKLSISPVVQDHGVDIAFKATGLDGTLYHQEKSLIAPSMTEKLCLWNLNTNVPGLLEHTYLREEKLEQAEHSFVFGFGDIQNKNSFREEIGIDLWMNGDISYRYLWGMPGGEFEPRSAVRLQVKKNSRDLFALPANLPVPQDDGACDHLTGMAVSSISLPSTKDRMVNLFAETERPTVFFFYPRTGRPEEPAPADWDDIPGARGCTPQSCGFRDEFSQFRKLGVQVFGISSQTTEYQKEFAERTNLPYEILSDHALTLTRGMRLPTFNYNSMTLIKRMAWFIENGKITKIFYPVFPSNQNANTVLSWLETRWKK